MLKHLSLNHSFRENRYLTRKYVKNMTSLGSTEISVVTYLT